MAGLEDLQITVADGKPVTFSPEAGKPFLPGNKVVEPEKSDGGLLAQASSEGDFVALGTATSLITLPLDGSDALVLALPDGGTGDPAAPVVQNGCVHEAWSGANRYVLSCDREGDVIDIPKSAGKSKFVFRQNRDVVVLNAGAADDEVGEARLRPSSAQLRLRLNLDDGATKSVDNVALIARNPAGYDGAMISSLISVRDTSLTVSKTHLHVRASNEGLWVIDRHSTNGTAITRANGVRTALAANTPALAGPGARVHFGDRSFTVGRA